MPECLLCAYIIHQSNVCLIFREVNDRTMSTDVKNCYIIIRLTALKCFTFWEWMSFSFCQLHRLDILMTSSQVVCGARLDVRRGIRPRRGSKIHSKVWRRRTVVRLGHLIDQPGRKVPLLCHGNMVIKETRNQ
jgi:hypothetical protein